MADALTSPAPARLFCGTSGFAYASWKPDFYPAKLPAKDFLRHYASRLNSVEVNYTFRRLPSQSTLAGWVESTPEGFTFSLKAHMRITHIQRLAPAEFTDVFFKAIDPLRAARRLGPVLFQLPPQVQAKQDVLDAFLQTLPGDIGYAFEFRHKSWLEEETYRVLERHRAALCLAESEKLVVPHVITGPFVYFRLRKGDYSPEDRAQIAAETGRLRAGGKDVYVYFKHEETPAGALYAAELLELK